MTKNRTTYFLTAIIVVLQIISAIGVAYAIDKDENVQMYYTNIYMLCQAICWVFAFAVIAMLATGLFRQLTWLIVMLWIGKTLDELFFDPSAIQWNDAINFFIAENIALVLITRHIVKSKL